MKINRRRSDKHNCYDGGHVFKAAGDYPHVFHGRCGKCGAQDWSLSIRILPFVMPHLAGAWYIDALLDP